jgi:hypothetical protein
LGQDGPYSAHALQIVSARKLHSRLPGGDDAFCENRSDAR